MVRHLLSGGQFVHFSLGGSLFGGNFFGELFDFRRQRFAPLLETRHCRGQLLVVGQQLGGNGGRFSRFGERLGQFLLGSHSRLALADRGVGFIRFLLGVDQRFFDFQEGLNIRFDFGGHRGHFFGDFGERLFRFSGHLEHPLMFLLERRNLSGDLLCLFGQVSGHVDRALVRLGQCELFQQRLHVELERDEFARQQRE